MNHLIKVSTFLISLTLLGFSQIVDNVQFSDMSGKGYDLYEVLESGKHILCHFQFNG